METINDRGLGALVYRLMVDEADRRLFPGLNLIVRDETKPGGACYEYIQKQRKMSELFRSKASEELYNLHLSITVAQELIYRKLAPIIFCYGVQLGPMLEKAPEGFDELPAWNRFWSLDVDDMDVDIQAKISRMALKVVAEMAGLSDLFPVLAVQDPQERLKLHKEQLEAFAELCSILAPGTLPGTDDAQRSKNTMLEVLEMLGCLALLREGERAPEDAPQDAPEDAPQDTSQDASQDAPQDAPQ